MLKIEGMTCAACSKAVERVTKKLDGVQESNVNLATEKLNITFDENKVSLDDIKQAIEKAGYKAKNDSIIKTHSGLATKTINTDIISPVPLIDVSCLGNTNSPRVINKIICISQD